MSSFELNKIFAAILCAGITVMLVSFIADKVVVGETLKKDAVTIEGAAKAGGHGGAAKKPKLPDPIMGLLAEADLAKGAKLSKLCASCHTFDKGGATKQGPNIWAIVNKAKAAEAGFSYSDAIKAAGGTWDYDALNKFLAKPKKYIKGTKMNFAGIKKPKDRAALIAWLRTQADSPAALPTEAQIAAEQAAFAPPAEEAPAEAPQDGHH